MKIKKTAGQGFAAATALSRGMGDLSMTGGLDETQNYEFKENNEVADSVNDIDDFERRLAGGGAPARPPPTKPTTGPAKVVKPCRPIDGAQMGAKAGAEYVQAAKKPVRRKSAAEDDEDDIDISVTQAMSDLARFEQEHGMDSDGE